MTRSEKTLMWLGMLMIVVESAAYLLLIIEPLVP